MSTTTPNMGLTNPTPSSGVTGSGDSGPGYAQNISNVDFPLIDSHDHSSGKGVQITPAGLNINGDLTFGVHNATQLNAARFSSQSSGSSTMTGVSQIYVLNGDLWYTNSSGQLVPITQGTSLSSVSGQGATGPAGAQGATGPAGTTTTVTDFFQGGITGYTGALIMNAIASGSNNVQWNQPQYQSGNIVQPTGNGTGSAWLNCNYGGLYEVSYQLSFTGFSAATLTGALVQCYVNGTGAIQGQGSAIPQSLAFLTSYQGGQTGAQANQSFIAQLASGVNIETRFTIQNIATMSCYLGPTGNRFTIKRIG